LIVPSCLPEVLQSPECAVCYKREDSSLTSQSSFFIKPLGLDKTQQLAFLMKAKQYLVEIQHPSSVDRFSENFDYKAEL
jgi:hypothetical protein